jgi:DNA-binding Xre family transcriptional regulator/ribosomal protein S27AE
MEEHSKKIYICNRCGRSDFMNGHALGGHKKYCGKPQYAKINTCKKRKKPKDEKVHEKIKKIKQKKVKHKKVGTIDNEVKILNCQLNELVNFKEFDIDQSLEYMLVENNFSSFADEKLDNIFSDLYFPFDYDQNINNDNIYNF